MIISKKLLIFSLLILTAVFVIELFVENKKNYITESEIVDLSTNIINRCSVLENRNTCYAKKIFEISQKYNYQIGKKTLLKIQEQDKTTADCHLIAHLMGEGEVKKKPGEWKQLILREDPSFCLGGFIHGILEYHLSITDTELSPLLINNVCKEFRSQAEREHCLHTIGHILLANNDYKVDRALSICDSLDKNIDPSSCYVGVYMEFATKMNLIKHQILEKFVITANFIDEMKGLCSTNNEKKNKACWGEMGRLYGSFYKLDLSKSISFCNMAPKYDYRKSCHGYLIVMSLLDDDITLNEIKTTCSYFNQDKALFNHCYFLSATQILYTTKTYHHIAWEICSLYDEEFQTNCKRELNKTEAMTKRQRGILDIMF